MGDSIERQLGRIEAKLDACLLEQSKEPERRKAIYDRLAVVEKWQIRLIAAGTVVLFVFGAAYKVVLDIARFGH